MAIRISPRELKDPVVFLGLGFGSGLSPVAPGTAGTLAAVPLYLLLAQFDLMIYLAVTLLVCVAGVWVCGYVSDKLKVHDHPGIVIDEFAGFFITMALAPQDWLWLLAGFALFRFFDALKPWPISWLDRNVGGGLGIMVDDIVAGLVSLVCLLGIEHFI